MGAVCPASGECCTMIFDEVDTDVFQYYLDFLAEEIAPLDSKGQLLIVDNASWHKAQRLNWHHFEVRYLPELQPRSQSSRRALVAPQSRLLLATSLRRAPSNLPSVFHTL